MGCGEVTIDFPAELVPFERLQGKWSENFFRSRKAGQEVVEEISSYNRLADFVGKQGLCSSRRPQE